MANNKNLIPIQSRPKEEQREIQRKGGQARGKQMKQQKSFRELCSAFANSAVTQQEFRKKMKAMGIADEDMTYKMAMIVSMVSASMKGNVRAFEAFRDTAGEVIDKNQSIDLNVNTSNDLLESICKQLSDDDE